MNDTNTNQIYTYIIKTINNEFYCGKTNNIKRRMKEHRLGNGWFSMNKRKDFTLLHIYKGDYERKIKRAGVKFIVYLHKNEKFFHMFKDYYY